MPYAQGGGEGKAAYIDTEGTFRPERIKAIGAPSARPLLLCLRHPSLNPLSLPAPLCAAAERFNLDAEAVLGNVRARRSARLASYRPDIAVAAQIIWTRAYTADALIESLTAVAAQFSEQPFKARQPRRVALCCRPSD
jgi:RecA/RadA recombinase